MAGKTFSNCLNPILTDIFCPIIKLLDQLEITHSTERYSCNPENKSHKINHELFLRQKLFFVLSEIALSQWSSDPI
jgi:hypothetical protein